MGITFVPSYSFAFIYRHRVMATSSATLDLYLAIFGGSFVMLLLVGCVVGFIVLYQKRLFRQELMFKKMELKYQQELINSTLEGMESERKRLSRDLHDEIGAALSTMRLLVGQMPAESRTSPDIVLLTDKYKALIDNTIDNVRRISNDLLPNGLEEFGLSYAIEGLCEKSLELTDADINWSIEDIPEASSQLNLMIYRIIQELLNNTIKYAEATQIDILITKGEHQLLLHYTDNGKGFDYEDAYKKKSLGLKNIETRIRMFDGTLVFNTRPNEGISVKATIPFV
ncbi:MAG: histidine kinase [Spirosomataceae bacterium]